MEKDLEEISKRKDEIGKRKITLQEYEKLMEGQPALLCKKREHDECSALTQLKAFVKTKLHIQNFDHSSATMQCNAMQRLKSIHEFANSQIAKIWINDHLFFSL